MVCEEDSHWSFAAIRDNAQKSTKMYRITSALPGGATITEIEAQRVIIANNGRAEYLEMEQSQEAPSTPVETPSPARKRRGFAQVPDEIKEGVRKTGDKTLGD